ncbi:fructose bisphosphate aldolase [Allopontixanthobacter sediminis]|uniref:fructose-bisphosphate aldolase n=1 Tax=Allopontixanthobacter sediminis TaxID=1689985 RepID=A0A845B0S6_9SPHN|nr:fructose bisphosphate aldolase [Allopontixanthobacter sediminis]MXP43786.1 fructose bisphosphate aldolase [Allopontixanthobacter sediminis]
MHSQEMTAKIANGHGFIAALDQSGGSTPKALRGYGVDDSEWSGEDEMFGRIHDMRCRIVTSPSFNGEKVLGAILFEKTMDGCVADGTSVPDALKSRGIVPFLKVDKGLEDEADGVQLMKPNPTLDALLEKGKAAGIFGTKMRSVIQSANPTGIAAIVDQQFEVGRQILGHGLMPIIEPEVNIKAEDRAQSEQLLLAEILRALEALPEGEQIMLKLSLPVEANLYKPLVDHPKVLRLVALSGGFSREEACAHLARNSGMIASFSRALLEELRAGMDDAEFDASLASAIDDIQAASVAG